MQRLSLIHILFENCDLSGAKLLEATLQKVRLRGFKLSGVNFAAAVLSDVTREECVAEGAVFWNLSLIHICGAVCSAFRIAAWYRRSFCTPV